MSRVMMKQKIHHEDAQVTRILLHGTARCERRSAIYTNQLFACPEENEMKLNAYAHAQEDTLRSRMKADLIRFDPRCIAT